MKGVGGRSTIKDECAMITESAEEVDMLMNLLCKNFTHPIFIFMGV